MSVQLLEGNLLRVLGTDADGAQLRALSREAMRSYARYWLEIFRLPVMSKELLVSRMDENGHVEEMLGHLAAGARGRDPAAAHGQLGPGGGVGDRPRGLLHHDGVDGAA